MLALSKSRLINTKIAQFYKTKKQEEYKIVSAFFQENGSFNSVRIVEYIWPNLKSDEVLKDLENYKFEDYLQCCNKLLPIFQYTRKIFKDFKGNTDNVLKLQWMGNNVNSYLEIKNNYNNIKTETFEHTLILTSLLSNALTNLYLSQSKGKHAPQLLKDLINSYEIINLFGFELIIILKILMGSPYSINLRNIVWHGFPKPMEIPSYYVDVLLITIHSLGCVVETKKIESKDRNQITSFNEHVDLIAKDFQLKPINLECVEEKVLKMNNDFNLYWQQLLFYYKSQKNKEFIMLALPQIELLLRLHYGAVNNFDISAKLDEYYITIETIFKSNVQKGDTMHESSNKLLEFENSRLEGCFHLLYDIFISPNGCRLRDKVSHGEVHLNALNNSQLCSLVLHIFLNLLFPHELQLLEGYESKLHLNCTTKMKLRKSLETLKTFSSSYLDSNQELSFKSLELEYHKTLIFKRPKKESELMLLINNIAENIYKTILNYEEAVEIRRALLAQRELHSKRRKTLKNLQTALPQIFETLTSIISTSSRVFAMMQNDISCIFKDGQYHDRTLRFLKRCLTISQNFVKYSHYENNEWIKSLELCQKYDEFYKKLLLYNNQKD